MKKFLYLGCLLGCVNLATAQTDSNSGVTTMPNADVRPETPGSTNPTGVYETAPPASSSSDYNNTSTAPGGLKQSNTFGTEEPAMQTEPAVTEPYNDYHLSNPSRTPAGAAPNVTQPVAPAEPNNDNSMYQRPQNNNGMIRLDPAQLPWSVRETLKQDTYSGWENSALYYDQQNKQYSIDVGAGEGARNYRFDGDGNVVQPSAPRQ